MTGERCDDRRVFQIAGADRVSFLQGLVTNDVGQLGGGRPDGGLVYAALLSPQGKYLADFFLSETAEAILLDVKETIADAVVRRLGMYRLRADVAITASDLKVQRGIGPMPQGGFADPRDASLGWRLYSGVEGSAPVIDWDALRVAGCIPETGIELIPDDTYILEAGFERLHGVDFRKGCYVGQEVTARMKHKTELRKGFVTVGIDGVVPVGAEIVAGGKPVGQIFTQSGGRAIAYLRFDRIGDGMMAGEARVTGIG